MKKEAKKKAVGKRKSQVKPINVPNKCPSKEEAENARDDTQTRQMSAKEMAQRARLEKVVVRLNSNARRALNDLTKEAQKRAADTDEKETVKATAHFVKGMVLSVEVIPKEGMSLMQIKDFFRKFVDVEYVVQEAGSKKR